MSVSRVFAPEFSDHLDPLTGVQVRQWTAGDGDSHHPYFTNNGWYDDGGKLLFGRHREGCWNLYSLDLASGEITQLTDLPALDGACEVEFFSVSVNPVKPEAYFWYGREMRAIDLYTYESRTLWVMPTGFISSMLSCTADGKHVCAGIWQDLSDQLRIDLHRGYVGFREIFEAKPESRIMHIATNGDGASCVWHEKAWIGHVNTSPTQSHLLTFCHEGPWAQVINRIWMLDIATGQAWQVRHPVAGETVGHEYWYADGLTIGYHGSTSDGHHFFGHARYDDTQHVEAKCTGHTGHVFSQDRELIVGDGGGVIRLWQWQGQEYAQPRILTTHRSSMKTQFSHPHPRFSPDGASVLFTSDSSGACQLYQADLRTFESLPLAEN